MAGVGITEDTDSTEGFPTVGSLRDLIMNLPKMTQLNPEREGVQLP